MTTYNRFLWEGETYPILSDNRAMSAPSWSLPAAITCPGMLADSDNAICSGCYAQLGRYAMRGVAEPQAARLAWMLAHLDNPSDWIRQIVDALRAANCIYARLHDSGDWFSLAQCRAWYEILRQTPEVHYWAPTRSWRVPHLLPELRRLHSLPNCTIRPSALYFDQPAPVVEGLGAGMASHYRDAPHGRTCPKTEAGSCAAARCRTCWDSADGPVSFQAHGHGGTHRPTPPSATQRKTRLGIVRDFVPLENVLGVIRRDAGRANG